MSGFGGRETPGNVYVGADGSVEIAPIPGQGKAPDATPATPSSTPAEAAPDAGALTDDEVAELKGLLASKVYTAEELQRHRGLTDAELALVAAPVPTASSIAKELAELSEMRRSDPKRFWSDEVQARQLRLIEAQQAMRAGRPAPAAVAASPKPAAAKSEAPMPEGLDAIERELAEIAAARKADRRRYDKDEALQAREVELIAAREQARAAAWVAESGQSVVSSILEAAPELEESFSGVFDRMSPESQDLVRRVLADPPARLVRSTEDQLNKFAGLGDEASALVKEWGSRASHRLGAAFATLDGMAATMSESDFNAAQQWLAGLSVPQRVAVVRALGGSRRRWRAFRNRPKR